MIPDVADVVVARLRAAGVRAMFGVPGGGGNLDLIEAAGHAGLPFVLTTTETGGAVAALAQAEVSGTCGACLTTLGPGVTSVVNGIACAYLDRAPVLVFTDTHPASAAGMSHQRVDHRELMRPVTKSSDILGSTEPDVVVDRAVAVATSSPQGPVHLDCLSDGPDGRFERGSRCSVEGGADAHTAPVRVTPDFGAIVSRARRPLLIVGLGARQPASAAAIRRFCERRGVPAMVTYKAKGVVADSDSWFAGVFTNGAIERGIADDADLLIGVGFDPVELIPRRWTFRQPIVYCGPGPLVDAHVPFAGSCIAFVDAALARVDAHLVESHWDAGVVGRQLADARQRVRVSAADRLSPDRVVDVAAGRLGRTHRVVVDAGAHMFPATMLWPVCEPNGLLISNGLSTMAFAVPAAIGAALADRSRPVVALIGDGGLLMCAGELLTAVRERLHIITIVFSDNSLSLIEIKQQARNLRPKGVALGRVGWPQLAESMGVAGFSSSTAAELDRAIEEAVAVDGPSLVEAHVDRTGYSDVLRAIRG